MAKKKGGGHEGGGGGHDSAGGMRWLLTYADMITLLLALFIFLYSISEVNAAKLNAFTTSMAKLFGIGKVPQSASSSSGGSGILPQANAIVQLKAKLQREFKDLIDSGMASVEKKEEGVTLRLKDQVLFDLGSADLSPKAWPVLDDVAKSIRNMPNPVRVEGHTDDVPMAPGGKYPTNWDLSAARAASVAKYLIDKCGLEPRRLSIAGYAEFKPIAPNRPRLGNAENRRVEIMVLKKLDEESLEALNAPDTAAAKDAPPSAGADDPFDL